MRVLVDAAGSTPRRKHSFVQLCCGGGARPREGGDVPLVEGVGKNVRHARHVLVGEHAADGDRMFAGPAASDDVGEKHLGRLRIVTDVDDGGHRDRW